ncbi:efflux RND transporter periplasmic adaptor subunit [Myxococcaceae bacterium JPH2]|nr:efflux RND transporter periplasmic adaptor subunit [Myxococcaceae bacterium JPH2]
MRLVSGWGRWGMVLALVAGCHDKDASKQQGAAAGKALPVQVLSVKPGPVLDSVEYVGTLISRRSITVFPQVAGYVETIPVRPGDTVKQGQVLLVVDPRQVKANLRAIEAQRASAIANREYARRTRQRSEQLLKEGLTSRQDYDQAVAQAEQAEAQARSSEAQIQAQQVQLGFYNVSAPFSGTVGDIPVKIGDYVTPQSVLTRVDQSLALELSVQVPVERAAHVEVGKTPMEVLDGEGKPVVRAPVFFVAPTPNTGTQLVEVKAAFDNTAKLRAGQLVRAQIIYSARDALKMPTAAVTHQGTESFAMVVAQGDGGTIVKRTPVDLGRIQGNDYEILGGLDAGTQVVVSSLQLLRDGMPIQPKEAPPPSERTGTGGGADAGQ